MTESIGMLAVILVFGRIILGVDMQKSFVGLLFVTLLMHIAAVSAANLYLGPHLMVEVSDPDFTVQDFPDFDVNETRLAFWNGEQLVGLVNFVGHYPSSKPFSDYYDQFVAEIEEGATDVRFRELRPLTASGGFEIGAYHAFYRESGEQVEALFYFFPSGDGYQVVMCMVIGGANYKEVAARMDAVMISAQPQ